MGKKSKNKNNKPIPCYHGCSKKEFNNCGEHYKVLEYKNTVDVNENKRVLLDPSFSRFVVARITDDFLKGKNNDLLQPRLLLLLYSRYFLIPEHEGKDVGSESKYDRDYMKYYRDIDTERGRINCMAREIPCDCMEEKRIEAKAMDKVAMCIFCRTEFSKKKMLRCKCDLVQYCSKECSKKDWPGHKELCRSIRTQE